jgi:hypothetical protein
LNGLAGAAFNAGSTTRLRTSAINLTAYNKLSVAVVFSDELVSAMHTFGFGDVAGDVGSVALRQNWAGAGLVSPYSLGFNTCWQDTFPTTDSCATPAAWLMTCDFALANYHKLYKNNSEIALRTIIGGAPGASLGNHAFGVGGRAIAYSPTYSMTGVFGEIILTTGLMSIDDRAKLQTYFHNTWGL